MIFIVLTVMGIIAVVLIKSNWRRGKQLAFFLAFLICGLIAYIIFDIMSHPEIIEKGSFSFISQIPWIEIILYLVMIAGMAAKYFYDAIGKGNKIEFNKWQFIKPVFISPIVFGSIYSTIGGEASRTLLLVFSFQNGFFWQTVLYKSDA